MIVYQDIFGLRDGTFHYEIDDPISCMVTEQRNGCFDCELQYPINGLNAGALVPNAIIMVEPRRDADPEPFKIYEIDQTIEGIFTARAHHIVYDLDGVVQDHNVSTGISAAITIVNNAAITATYNLFGDLVPFFEMTSDGITDTTSVINIEEYISMWAYIGKLVEVFGGELSYKYDASNHKVVITLSAARGVQKDAVIGYGVNIINLDRKQTSYNLYKDVVAWWWDGADTASMTYASVATGLTGTIRSLAVDCTKLFQTKPTYAQLQAAASSYISEHNLTEGIHDELTVDFVPLEITTENIQSDEIELCDTVTVDASIIGVQAQAKCVEVIYNAITRKYDSVKVGIIQDTIIDTISTINPSGLSSSSWQPSTGSVISDSPSSSSLASGSYVSKANVTLPAGTWVVTFGCAFSTNSTGYRKIVLSATQNSSTNYQRGSNASANALSGEYTFMGNTAVIVLTTNTTLYLNSFQNSGSSLTAYPYIKAVKIV